MSDRDPFKPARSFDIDGRALHVFDGLLPNAAAYADGLSRAAFTRTEVARPDTAGYRHWVTQTRLEALREQPIHALTMRAVEAIAPAGYRYEPYRAYTNVANYGDMLFTHVDCLPEREDLTALWYICDLWDVEWGGETVFFDAADEIAAAVRPQPGRLVIFDGRIKHVGRPPNRICYFPRYTFAIKFQRARP
ncbi:2OG-Fe(II) oxygenase [Cognatilysobacter lacus]|uniref:2OG-Fe(II) oxygenase n=1 Tax=Cognatilysobacter lacus TaxID=1643323 RepID=A0A5D8ZA90_9GAMM|nr:2OG-Fe(II) oxygenase [Lysobacter lacus]TZF91759.1 2OG-Fe(II) oxygenase [Lysobacter lacus]